MGRRPIFLVAALLLALFASPARADLEVDQRIRELESRDGRVRLRAVRQLAERGAAAADAIPALEGCLRDPSFDVRRAAAGVLPRLGAGAVSAVRGLLLGKDADLREACLRTLAYVESVSAELLPCLRPLLSAELGQRSYVAYALARIGPPAVDVLIAGIPGQEPEARRAILQGLARVGVPAVAPLGEALAHEDAEVRAGAARALGTIGPPARSQATRLTGRLSDESPAVRVEAALALGRIGGPSIFLFALLSRLQDPDPRVGEAVAASLGSLGPPALPGLLVTLAGDNVSARRHAAFALRTIAPTDERSRVALRKALDDSEIRVALHAAAALRRCPEETASAAEVAARALRSAEADVVCEALRVADALGPAAPGLLPPVASLLEHGNSSVRIAAVMALGSFGKQAAAALPKLRELAADGRSLLAVSAAATIVRIEPGDAAARRVLLSALPQRDLRTPLAAEALATLGAQVVPELVASLGDSNYHCPWAEDVVVAIGPAAIPPLLQLLERPGGDADARVHAARILARVAPDDERVHEALVRGLRERNGRGRLVSVVSWLRDRIEPALRRARSGRDRALAVSARGALALVSDAEADPHEELIAALDSRDRNVQRDAAWWLAHLPLPSMEVATQIADTLCEKRLFGQTPAHLIGALGRVGRVGASLLARVWKTGPRHIRASVARELGRMGPVAADAAPVLRSVLFAPAGQEREVAACALAEIGTHRLDALITLADLLETEKQTHLLDRWKVKRSFQKLLSGADESLEGELVALVTREPGESERRVAAIRALDPAGVESDRRIAALLSAVCSEDKKVRDAALEELGETGADLAAVSSRLRALLESGEKGEKLAALQVLAGGTGVGEDVVRAIRSLLKAEDLEVRAHSAIALHHVDPDAKDGLAALTGLLESRNPQERAAGARALGTIGESARESVLARLDDPRPHVRASAVKALVHTDPLPVKSLSEALESRGPDVRWRILAEIGDWREAHQAGLPLLVAALTDEDARVRAAAMFALWKLRPPPVADLSKVLEDGTPIARFLAVRALGVEISGSYRDRAKERAAVLFRLFEDPQTDVRCAAVYSFLGLVKQARPHRDRFERLAKDDPSEDVRAAATAVLRRVFTK